MKTIQAIFCSVLLLAIACSDVQANDYSSYRLGSGDVIAIQVFGEEDLSMEVRLNRNPTITYPFIGQVPVLGRTINEVEISLSTTST